jgi:hypothetical protein
LNQLQVKVGQVNTTAQSGFSNLAQGLNVLIQLQAQANDLLAANDKQNVAIICWLDHIARVLCDVKTTPTLKFIFRKRWLRPCHTWMLSWNLVHAREAMEIMNRQELEQRLDECCPEKEIPLQPALKIVSRRSFLSISQSGRNWQPIHFVGSATDHPK